MKKASSGWRWGLAILLGLIFMLQGATKLFGPASVQWAMRFVRWGYPVWFSHLVGVVEIAAGLGCFVPRSQKTAAVALMVLMTGALGTHLSHGEFLRVVPPLILGGMALLLFRSVSPKDATAAGHA